MARVLRIVRDENDQTPIVDRPAELVRKIEELRRIEERISFVPTRERPSLHMKPRGVYVSNSFDPNGNPVVYAIRANGRALPQALPWLEGADVKELQDQMWDLLDRVDPVLTIPYHGVSSEPDECREESCLPSHR
jgi:hypothetical protein